MDERVFDGVARSLGAAKGRRGLLAAVALAVPGVATLAGYQEAEAGHGCRCRCSSGYKCKCHCGRRRCRFKCVRR